jgi:hypothetical protein
VLVLPRPKLFIMTLHDLLDEVGVAFDGAGG